MSLVTKYIVGRERWKETGPIKCVAVVLRETAALYWFEAKNQTSPADLDYIAGALGYGTKVSKKHPSLFDTPAQAIVAKVAQLQEARLFHSRAVTQLSDDIAVLGDMLDS